MAWEWSHTDGAYANAEANIRELPKAKLLEVLREWAYDDREKAGRRPSFRLPRGLRRMGREELADLVWLRASELRTCSNGGGDCYICPDGCHTVSFDGEYD